MFGHRMQKKCRGYHYPKEENNSAVVLGTGTKDIEKDNDLNSVQVDSNSITLTYNSNKSSAVKTGDAFLAKQEADICAKWYL